MTESSVFDQLFEAYKSNYSNSLMTQQQNENLRVWHERRKTSEITLSQIDEWMMRAGLIQKKVLSIVDTGMCFSKFKWVGIVTERLMNRRFCFSHLRRFSLNDQQFEQYLAVLSEDKHLSLEDVKTKLLSADFPSKNEEIFDVSWKNISHALLLLSYKI